MKQRVLTVLFISTVILFVVIFGMTTVQCVKAFSYDSLRIAETKTRESVEIFNENAEEYVLKTQFIAAQLQGKAYETEEDYADLMKLLASDAESNGFLSLSVFDKRGEHHTMRLPITATVPRSIPCSRRRRGLPSLPYTEAKRRESSAWRFMRP